METRKFNITILCENAYSQSDDCSSCAINHVTGLIYGFCHGTGVKFIIKTVNDGTMFTIECTSAQYDALRIAIENKIPGICRYDV